MVGPSLSGLFRLGRYSLFSRTVVFLERRSYQDRKGGGKSGKDGGKKRGGKGGDRRSTDTGRGICYDYNAAEGCSRQDCPYTHCCQNCLAGQTNQTKAHPMMSCPVKKKTKGKGGGKTQGVWGKKKRKQG